MPTRQILLTLLCTWAGALYANEPFINLERAVESPSILVRQQAVTFLPCEGCKSETRPLAVDAKILHRRQPVEAPLIPVAGTLVYDLRSGEVVKVSY